MKPVAREDALRWDEDEQSVRRKPSRAVSEELYFLPRLRTVPRRLVVRRVQEQDGEPTVRRLQLVVGTLQDVGESSLRSLGPTGVQLYCVRRQAPGRGEPRSGRAVARARVEQRAASAAVEPYGLPDQVDDARRRRIVERFRDGFKARH